MMRQRLNALPLEQQWTALLLGLAVLLGAVVRFLPGVQAGFPINDGGMFYVMTQELIANRFTLPLNTAYNGLGIPYAYPPLGFYAAGLTAALTGASLLDVFRFLPAAVSALCVPLVYLLARDLTSDSPLAALAALLYALLPRSFIFLIMGGGVTRAWGHLFLLLTAWLALRAFQHPAPRRAALAGLAGALVILSHPEAAVHTAAFGLVTWLVYGRTWQGARIALLIALTAALASLPWWGLMLARHGLAPYIAAFGTGNHNPWSPFLFPLTNFTEEAFLTLMATLSLLGIFLEAKSRRFILLGIIVTVLAASPRSATAPLMIPVALLAAITLQRLILPALCHDKRDEKAWMQPAERLAGAFLGLVVIYSLFGAVYLANKLATEYSLSRPQREGMQALAKTAAAGQPVLVISGNALWQYDQTSEWLPALSEATSVTTVQGREWLPGLDFADFGEKVNQLQTHCPFQDEACLRTALESLNAQPSVYIYADLSALRANLNLPEDVPLPLVEALKTRSNKIIMWEDGNTVILLWRANKGHEK